MVGARGNNNGFTIIELIVTISIIGILTGIVIFSPKAFLVTARDQERSDDVASIARRLEQAYQLQDLGRPAYPSTTELAADISGSSRTMAKIKPEALIAPNASASSVISATSATIISSTATGSPTLLQYVYQPLTATDTLCTANPSTSAPCVRFNLYYRLENGNLVQQVKSLHQQ